METSNKHNQNEYSYLRRLPIDKLLELLALAPSLSDRPEDEAYIRLLQRLDSLAHPVQGWEIVTAQILNIQRLIHFFRQLIAVDAYLGIVRRGDANAE